MPASAFVLRDVAALDPTGRFVGPLDVSVADGKIGRVGEVGADPSVRDVDCAGLFLMPGVFDCHTHLSMGSGDQTRLLAQPISRWALEAAANALDTLRAGVTSVRDACGADAGIRDAIADGVVPGPRTQISVVLLHQTGGHGDGFLLGPGAEMFGAYMIPDYPGRPVMRVDGIDAMVRAVREIIRAGGDWIKLAVTGGVMSPHDDPLAAELSREEIEVAVREARRAGRPVMAHAFGGKGLDNAVEAGVRSIEHGIFLTEQQAARMAARGCWLVPTLAVMEDINAMAQEGTLAAESARKLAQIAPLLGEAVAIARAAGVRIALGTDAFFRTAHGRNLREIALMQRAGLTVPEALTAATSGGAELCGVADSLGKIAPGYAFDAILLDEEPDDLSLFERPEAVTGVFKDGVPVVPHPRLGT